MTHGPEQFKGVDRVILSGPLPRSSEWRSNVVLLHGLFGNTRDPWSIGDGQPWWSQLSKRLEGATIISYGVPQSGTREHEDVARVLEKNAQLVLDDMARDTLLNRPTYFIAYSNGGILLKRLLSDMEDHPTGYFRHCGLNVGGMTFLGVPHRGSKWASRANRRVSRFISEHVKDLAMDSRPLKDTQDRFKNALGAHFPHASILSVVEARPPKYEAVLGDRVPKIVRRALRDRDLRSCIVEPASATLGFSNEVVLSAQACHFALPKLNFEGSNVILEAIAREATIRTGHEAKDYAATLLRRV